jgi:hypothetical protein
MKTILSNDLKKGDYVLLVNGWQAKIEDNKRGNTRLATVYGTYTEMGSIYVHDIRAKLDPNMNCLTPILLTEKQQKLKNLMTRIVG